jgi:hypothetical protein
MSVPPEIDADGRWQCARGFPTARVALLLALLAVAAVAVVQVF